MQTLVLTNAYQPHKVTTWQKALTLYFKGKVEIVDSYDEDIRSVSFVIKMPSVVRLVRALRGSKKAVKFSRGNVMTRDKSTCQYCGKRKAAKELTFDHVIPRSRGGKTEWKNIALCCRACNSYKGDRTPEEAGMRLLKKPEKPASLPLVVFTMSGKNVPSSWRDWLASYSYWQGELDGE